MYLNPIWVLICCYCPCCLIKAVPLCAMEVFGGRGSIAPTHSWPRHYMGWMVSITPRPRFTPGGRTPGTHWIGGWVGPRAGLDAGARRKILCPCRGSKPDRPACSRTLYPCCLIQTEIKFGRLLLLWTLHQNPFIVVDMTLILFVRQIRLKLCLSPRFGSSPGNRLSWLRLYVVFQRPSWRILR
jgi:hypothetical protein